ASVIVEEALKMKIPVVVFDPTAQWTGFVKACKDENLLDNYSKFNMKREEAKPYKGMIFEVDRTDVNINLKKYMNPGEVTIFNLSRLKPGEYDIAVMNIIQTIFDEPWEESPQLKLLVVFDEVHRLLEKYGGKGGYIALEKACREFRKWGIGLIMASQVSADFKEAVQGNILTEIQLNTKSMEDINKIKSKYGPEFAKRITKQSIGVGIIQNPQYNDGKPWFVNFRPTLHDPHKITEEELKQYDAFAKNLEEIEQQIIMLEKENIDTTDIRLEFKLAQDKLKSGRFRMAEIYLNVLKENLKKIR
ncbi:MAG: ATP-binding protein, partial [Candidatus Aenigmarchaeota archaeon]|nr:ATP-binding protein [Candidatus Aenigmarchaeota archaeon]